MTLLSTSKDPIQLLVEADGEPRWLREFVQEVFNRLPPVPPPAPPKAPDPLPPWVPNMLAKLVVNPTFLPLDTHDLVSVAEWLRQMADGIEAGEDEGNGYLWTLDRTRPVSQPRRKRNGV